MALRNNALYFSHDANMRNDEKIRALRRKYGHMGYAIWCFILETLTAKDNFEMRFDKLSKELFAADYDISETDFGNIVEYLIHLDLIQLTNDILSCRNLTKRFEVLEQARKQRVEAGRSSAAKRKATSVQREATSVQREATSVQREATSVQREATNNSIVKNSNISDGAADDAHAKKEKNDNEKLATGIKEMCEEQIWTETIRKQFHITDNDEWKETLNAFLNSCIMQGTTVHDSINNIKAHFTNWLRIRRTAKEQEQNGNSTSKSQLSRHADLSVTATSAADYEGAF